jgi:hypothetical protein
LHIFSHSRPPYFINGKAVEDFKISYTGAISCSHNNKP